MSNSITVSSWTEFKDLIDTLAIADVVSIDQMTILYTSDCNNQYCLNLDVADYSINDYPNRRRNKDNDYLRNKTSQYNEERDEDE